MPYPPDTSSAMCGLPPSRESNATTEVEAVQHAFQRVVGFSPAAASLRPPPTEPLDDKSQYMMISSDSEDSFHGSCCLSRAELEPHPREREDEQDEGQLSCSPSDAEAERRAVQTFFEGWSMRDNGSPNRLFELFTPGGGSPDGSPPRGGTPVKLPSLASLVFSHSIHVSPRPVAIPPQLAADAIPTSAPGSESTSPMLVHLAPVPTWSDVLRQQLCL